MSKVGAGGDAPNFGIGALTLRDYFAGKALAGWLSDGCPRSPDATIAREAYAIADAMLAERQKV